MKSFKSFILCCSFALIFTMFGGEVISQSQVSGSELPNYKNWEQTADKIEQVIVTEEVSSKDLDALRKTLSEWRTLFSIGKELNAQRIIRINKQIHLTVFNTLALITPPSRGCRAWVAEVRFVDVDSALPAPTFGNA